MEKSSDKGPIFAQGPAADCADDVRDLVLETLGDEFAWAAKELAGPLVAELAETWKMGPGGVTQVRRFLRSVAREGFGIVVGDAEKVGPLLELLRASRKLVTARNA